MCHLEYSLIALVQHPCNARVIYHKSFTTTQIEIERPGVECFPDLLGIFEFVPFFQFLLHLCFWGCGGIEGTICKILELLGKHPEKNDLSKSATFDPSFQLSRSALVT